MPHTDTSTAEKTSLTTKQVQAARLLAEGTTAVQAAERCGVSRSTLERWKNVPEFQAAIREMEDTAYTESLRMLKRASRAAISCLICCMDPKVSAYTRVAAASKILDMGITVHEIAPLKAEIEELRELLQAKGNT